MSVCYQYDVPSAASLLVNDRDEDDRSISLLAYDQYVRELAWNGVEAPFTEAEEGQLLAQFLHAKCDFGNGGLSARAKDVRDRLVSAYQPFVLRLAHKYAFLLHNMDVLDLVQEGNLGLLQAIEKYDGSLPFGGLVACCVRFAIVDALHEKNVTVRLPPLELGQWYAARRAERSLRFLLGRDPSVAEIAAEVGISEQRLRDLRASWFRCRALSLQGLLEQEENAEEYLVFVSLFASVACDEELGQSSSFVQVLDLITDRQRDVLALRYGLRPGQGEFQTQRQVAAVLGVPQQAVFLTEQRALATLRERLELVCMGGKPSCRVRELPVVSGDLLDLEQEYYTASQVASMLGISVNCVRLRAERGHLPVVRMGAHGSGGRSRVLFPKSHIDALAQKEKVSS